MSHFTVMVDLGTKIDPTQEGAVNGRLAEMLAPYDENTVVEPYRRYEDNSSFSIRSCVEGWTDKERGEVYPPTLECRWNPADEPANLRDFADAYGRDNPGFEVAWTAQVVKHEAWDQKINSLYTPAEIAEAYNKHYKYEATGDIHDEEPIYADLIGVYHWSTYNPKSRWDWWSLGGRWTGYFVARHPGVLGSPGLMTERPTNSYACDVVRKGEIDFAGIADQALAERKETWAQAAVDANQDPGHREFMYGIKKNETRGEFLTRDLGADALGGLRPFAYVDGQGRWFEKGKMGWWAVVINEDEEFYDRTFREWWAGLSDRNVIALVDCHI